MSTKIKSTLLSGLKRCAITGIALGFGAISLSAFASNEIHQKTGTFVMHINSISAVMETGEPANSAETKICQQAYNQYLNQPVVAKYFIQGGEQSSELSIFNKMAPAFPMGLSNRYGFITDGAIPVAAHMKISSFIFQMSIDFTNPQAFLAVGYPSNYKNPNASYCLLKAAIAS